MWDFSADGEGRYHVRLAYDDDLVALGALRAATACVDWLMLRVAEKPDVEAAVARLREMRTK